MTTLDLYCSFRGWQGGTIHQALADFNSLTRTQQDEFCNRLIASLGTLTDGFAVEFTRARLDQYQTITPIRRRA
jgi:hypothetical protein